MGLTWLLAGKMPFFIPAAGQKGTFSAQAALDAPASDPTKCDDALLIFAASANEPSPARARSEGVRHATRRTGGQGAARKDHSRVARLGHVARMTVTVTAMAATNRCQQRPATAHNTRPIRANWGYVRPENGRSQRSSRRDRLAAFWPPDDAQHCRLPRISEQYFSRSSRESAGDGCA